MKQTALIVFALLIASPALASETSAMQQFIWQWVNLIILIGVLVFVARKPIRSFLAGRRLAIKNDLDKSKSMLEEAETKLSEWQQKIDVLDEAMFEIEASSTTRTAAEREQILVQAEAAADRIKADARAVVDQELTRAREELRSEAANLAVDLAAKLIKEKISDADQERLVTEFAQRLEALPSESTKRN